MRIGMTAAREPVLGRRIWGPGVVRCSMSAESSQQMGNHTRIAQLAEERPHARRRHRGKEISQVKSKHDLFAGMGRRVSDDGSPRAKPMGGIVRRNAGKKLSSNVPL